MVGVSKIKAFTHMPGTPTAAIIVKVMKGDIDSHGGVEHLKRHLLGHIIQQLHSGTHKSRWAIAGPKV